MTEAGSCADALEVLVRDRPDLLLSDIGMPREDGYALIRKVRALPESAGGRTPAIALRAYARLEHVTKPIEPGELLAVLASLVELSRAGAQSPDEE